MRENPLETGGNPIKFPKIVFSGIRIAYFKLRYISATSVSILSELLMALKLLTILRLF